MKCRKTMAEATNPPTLNERLTNFDSAIHCGWADDGAGSIDVELSPTADRNAIIELHKIADKTGYKLSYQGEEHDGTTHWQFKVEISRL